MHEDSTETGAPARRCVWLATAATFAAGLLTPFTVNVVGAMPLGELVLLGALGLALLAGILHRQRPEGFWNSRVFWLLLGCQVVALGGYVLADLYRGSATNDLLRGWARMIFLGLDLLAIGLLFGIDRPRPDWRPFLGFQWGYAAGLTVNAAFGQVLFGDYWKFGYAIPVTLAVLLLAPQLGYWVTLAATAGLGVLHMAMDYRSMGALCLLLPAGLALQKVPKALRFWVLPACVACGVGAIGWLYFAREAPTNRSSRSDVERTAMLAAAWNGFLESPVLGNGSWFSKSDVMEEFFAIRYERSMLEGVGSFSEDDETGGGIALHSQVLVGLAEGGILGGCFFIAYIGLLLWALAYSVLFEAWHRWSAIQLLTLLFALWSVAMSPFSGMHRILIAMATGLALMLWSKAHPGRATSPLRMRFRNAGATILPGEAAAK